MSTQPSGYINRRIPQSVEEAVAQYSVDSIKTITKATIQKYIESFLRDKGGNRDLFKAVTQEGLKFEIAQSFNDDNDPDKRRLQVARLFDGLRHSLPAIIIADNSFEVMKTNWTGIDAVSADNEFIYSRISIMRNLGISVVVGTRDRSTADMLHSILSVLFSELRFKAGGNRITGNTGEGENWVVCLCEPSMGTVSNQAVQDDPKDQIYLFTLELPNVLFEDHILYKEPRPAIPFLNEGIANPEGNDLGATKPEIIVPDTIKINQKTPVYFRLLQERFHTMRVSDPNICTFDPRDYVLSPRRLGTFEVQVVRSLKTLAGNTNTQEVVVSKTVRVVP